VRSLSFDITAKGKTGSGFHRVFKGSMEVPSGYTFPHLIGTLVLTLPKEHEWLNQADSITIKAKLKGGAA